MNEQELKSCPFCGSSAEYDGFYIECSNFRCGIRTGRDWTENAVFKLWNTRSDGWISAKVNHPKESCQVIAEWSNGDVEQSSYIADWSRPHFQRKCGTDENGAGWTGNVGYVVNWMPLPKAASCGE